MEDWSQVGFILVYFQEPQSNITAYEILSMKK